MRKIFTLIYLVFYSLLSFAQHDAKVEAVYTLAKIPSPLGVYKHVVQARIINKGSDFLTNLPVTLDVTGANTYSNTQITNIAPDDTVLISFTQFSPWNVGNNNVIVSVPNDDNNSNNSASYPQQINTDTFSYADDSAPLSSIGYGNGDGMLLTRYNVSGSAVVKKVNVHISNDASNIGNTVYGVVTNFGVILGQSAPHVITAGELDRYISLDIINPPDVDFDFYAGLLQTANAGTAYYPVSFQYEGIPTRPDVYYSSLANGSGLTSLNYFGRLMIQAVVEVGTVTPFNSSINTPNKVIAGWDFSGVNSPVSFAATSFDTLLSSSNLLTRGPGASASNGIHSFRSTDFQNNGIAVTNTDYFQLTLAPKPGDTLSLNAITGTLHGNSNDIASSPVRSQFAYSTDGVNFTLIGSSFLTNSIAQTFSVSLAGVAALQNIVNGTTITLRYYASGASASAGWGFISFEPGFNGLAVLGKLATSTTIMTSPVVPNGAIFTISDCSSTATGSISFSSTGNFCPENKYLVQLGQIYQPHFNTFRFRFPVIIGELQTPANSGVINFTIPAGTTAYDPYAIRIISTHPYTEGSCSQPFIINADYCRTQATDKFRSRASGNWNDMNSWESFNGTSWINATTVPDENSPGIEIRMNDTIDINSNVLVTNTVVRGTLRLLNGNGDKGMIGFINPPNPIPSSVAMDIDTSGVFIVVSSEAVYNDAILFTGGNIRIHGKITIGDGTASIASGFDGLASDDASSAITWHDGSVFEWNSVNGSGPGLNTYFRSGSEAVTFRLTNIPVATLGDTENTTVNGLLEVNTPVTWTGSGTKTFRDGIKGTSIITQDAGAGQFFVTSIYEEIPATNNTVAAFKGILNGTLNIHLGTNGLRLEGGATLPGSAIINLDGQCSSLQKVELVSTAKMTLSPGSILNIEDADLVNKGLIDGTGEIRFTGNQLSAFSSSGLTAAPILISHKQLFLGSNSNTGNITLADESNLRLDTYNLNMTGVAQLIADSANFIVTNDTGRLNRYVAGTDILYPVGINNTSYSPVTISNAGTEDYVKVRVAQGVQTTIPVTDGNVDRTWFVGDTSQTGMSLTLHMRWNGLDEQVGFDHNSCYVSHYTSCPPPLNCTTGYFDATLPGAALAGINSYSIQRNGLTNFRSPAFIVTSKPFVYTFTGSGDWNDASNWTPAIVAPVVIPTGIEVIIDGFGECVYNGDILIQEGGKLTVQPGKQLKLTGNLTID